MEPQRIAIIGSGAVAGVLAEAAQASGHQVTLCVRTPFERLTVETPEGVTDVPVTIRTEPADAPEADWVLLTTKIPDVASAAGWLRALDDGRAPLVIVQNGVEHEESVAKAGVRAPLLPALIYVGAERVRPGHIVRRSPVSVTIPGGELGTGFGELFSDGIQVRQTGDFRTAAWRKMLWNVAANPITALTMRRLEIFGDPDIREFAYRVLAEAIAVGRAEGADLSDADSDKVMDSYGETFLPENGTSMLYDRLAGLPTEHEHISGPVVAAGQRHGIPTPLNQALLALMRAL